MLKYRYYREIFSEVPSEIVLGISISGCIIRCKGCHSMELWEDAGYPLTIEKIEEILSKKEGITCLCLFGGEHDIDTLTSIFMHFYGKLKTAWYCGLDFIPKDKIGVLQYLDYYKIGHYDMDLGGLDSPTTNQHLFKLEHQGDGNYYETDITNLLQKKKW